MNEHHWSGWPGAFCLKCGAEDPLELELAGYSDGKPSPCPDPAVCDCMERHDPANCPVHRKFHRKAQQ